MIHAYVRIVADDDTYLVETSTAADAVRQYIENTGSTAGIKEVVGLDPADDVLYRVTYYYIDRE